MGESYACTALRRLYVPALMVLAGIGVLFAGVWFWNGQTSYSGFSESST